MQFRFLDAATADWMPQVEHLYAQLGYPNNPTLFPPHFTQVVLPKLGGRIVVLGAPAQEWGVGFLFPRALEQGKPSYTLRFHALAENAFAAAIELLPTLQTELNAADIVLYDPQAEHTYAATHHALGSMDIGRPSQDETQSMRRNHQSIWGSPPEFLYPTDIHSREFRLGTSLVSRVDGEVAGFLFGFYKLGGSRLPADWDARFNGGWRLESQAMGVLPAHRGKRIAYLLKWQQAVQAREEGIGVINWTADPLQYPNAALNFGLLRAVAFDHYTDLYPFRNELNQVPASRFGLTWLVGSPRVQRLPSEKVRAAVLALNEHPDVQRITRGAEVLCEPTAARIAIEIPANWTASQRDDVEQAQHWRETTDHIFQRHIGLEAGQYVITGAATDGDRRYLVGERADQALWDRLGGETV